jgi:hypothetical protein
LGMDLSGTHTTTSILGTSLRRISSSLALSVTTRPPSPQPQASSKAPVIVTPHSLAQPTPSLMASSGAMDSPRRSSVAATTALQTELELFSPIDGGISVRTASLYPSRGLPTASAVLATQVLASRSSMPGLPSRTTSTDSDGTISASVLSAIPSVEPIPHGMALSTDAAPPEDPKPLKIPPSSWPRHRDPYRTTA